MSAVILQFLPYLFQAAQTIPQIMDFLNKTRENLKQTGEWNQETEDAFTAELENLKRNPPAHWKTDDQT